MKNGSSLVNRNRSIENSIHTLDRLSNVNLECSGVLITIIKSELISSAEWLAINVFVKQRKPQKLSKLKIRSIL